VETIPCPHCGAPIKRVATFCLACDTPVVDTESGLSVGELIVVPAKPRPLLVTAILVGVLVVLGGSTYGILHFFQDRHANSESQAASDARSAVTLLVRAESGQNGACRKAAAHLTGSGRRQECLGIVGEDPGAHLENVKLGAAHLGSKTGTVRLTATVVDDHGSRDLDRVLDLDLQGKLWLMRWDGKPV
jgi:hypothetical protein